MRNFASVFSLSLIIIALSPFTRGQFQYGYEHWMALWRGWYPHWMAMLRIFSPNDLIWLGAVLLAFTLSATTISRSLRAAK